jgi:hypothetical protein
MKIQCDQFSDLIANLEDVNDDLEQSLLGNEIRVSITKESTESWDLVTIHVTCCVCRDYQYLLEYSEECGKDFRDLQEGEQPAGTIRANEILTKLGQFGRILPGVMSA